MRARAPAPARACTPHSAAAARAAETAILEQASPAGAGAAFPIVRARNVYVLPGVPELLRRKWQARPCPGGWPGVPELLRRKWQARPSPGGRPGVPELLRRKWQARPCPGGWSGAPKLLHRKWQPCPCLGG